MIALILAATLGAAGYSADDYPETPPCSDGEAVHVSSNHRVCAWEPPPPLPGLLGGSDYRGRGDAGSLSRRPDFTWRLRDGQLLPLKQVPASTLEVDMQLFANHSAACRTPEAVARLGADEAGRRAVLAEDCWDFLNDEEVRRAGEPRPEGTGPGVDSGTS